MRLSGYHRLWFRFFVCTIGLNIEWPHCSSKFCSVRRWFYGPRRCSRNASPMHIQELLSQCLYTSLGKVLSHLLLQCKTLVFALQFLVFFVRRSFHISRSPMYWRLSWQNSFGQFLQHSALIGFSMNSRNAVMREVLVLPEDCSSRTGISLISTFNKFSGVSLCVLKSGWAYAGVLQRIYFADGLNSHAY